MRWPLIALDPFADAKQAEAIGAGGFAEAATIIFEKQADSSVAELDLGVEARRAGVPDDVGQRLLCDAENMVFAEIVVDSSVWIANLRGLETPGVGKLRAAVDDASNLLIGDLILLEVLQVARDEVHADRIERNLRRYPVASMLNKSLAVQAARNYQRLRGGE